jgi:hypothetical protein
MLFRLLMLRLQHKISDGLHFSLLLELIAGGQSVALSYVVTSGEFLHRCTPTTLMVFTPFVTFSVWHTTNPLRALHRVALSN